MSLRLTLNEIGFFFEKIYICGVFCSILYLDGADNDVLNLFVIFINSSLRFSNEIIYDRQNIFIDKSIHLSLLQKFLFSFYKKAKLNKIEKKKI